MVYKIFKKEIIKTEIGAEAPISTAITGDIGFQFIENIMTTTQIKSNKNNTVD